MRIINKENHSITIQIKGGKEYTVEANSDLRGVPKEHAEFWIGLHPFLEIQEEIEIVKEETTEDLGVEDEVAEETIEEVKEETKDEIPKVKEDKPKKSKLTDKKK